MLCYPKTGRSFGWNQTREVLPRAEPSTRWPQLQQIYTLPTIHVYLIHRVAQPFSSLCLSTLPLWHPAMS